MQDEERITRAAGVVGMATLLSRIFGFIRDMVVAKMFGAGTATDAFFVAFRIPNLLRRLVGEGALTACFIPVYSEYIAHKTKEEANHLVHVAFSLLATVLVVMSLLGILLAPWIVKLMAYGFLQDPEKFQFTVFLTRLMFPYIFFISLVALAMGALNSRNHFAAPAFAPVLLNLSIVLCALLLSPMFQEPIVSLAVGVMVGGLAQFLFQIPFLRQIGITFRWAWEWSHPGIRRVGSLMAPSVLGLAVVQLNVLINTFLASYLAEGSVSYLYYADRLLEFPMGVFAIAIATAVLPSFSDQAIRKDWNSLKETVGFALRLTFFVTFPAMIGLVVLRYPIISLLFQRGAFDAHSTAMTAQALLFYAVGLVAFAGVRIIVPAFYSLQDTKTPVRVAILALLANAGFGVILMFPLKHGGLALATSLSAGLNFILLLLFLRKKIGSLNGTRIWASFFRYLVAAGIMALVVHWVIGMAQWEIEGFTIEKLFTLIAAIGSGVTVYGGASLFLGCEELSTLSRMIRRKIKKGS